MLGIQRVLASAVSFGLVLKITYIRMKILVFIGIESVRELSELSDALVLQGEK